jgi:hypothetical protein
MTVPSRLALLPLDDRPPTYCFPQRIAEIAGVELLLPPRELLGNFLQPGFPHTLAEWLRRIAPRVDGMLLAVDMLAYGGLVASRSPVVPLKETLRRLEVLKEIKATVPGIKLLASSVILRISITASNRAMARHYRNIIRYSELSYRVEVEHREELRGEYEQLLTSIPSDVLRGYLEARERNHLLNRRMVELLAGGILDKLILLQEDASVVGPHLIEQEKLRSLAVTLGVGERIGIYPGADEGTQTLLASWVNQSAPPEVGVVFTSEAAAGRAVPFEDRPLRETVAQHLKAAGCLAVVGPKPATILWVHTPCASPEVGKAADAIGKLLDAGRLVALADVRFPNGSDPELMEALAAQGVLGRLAAVAAWNTAGNTLGTTIAHLSAWLAAHRKGPTQEQIQAQQDFLWERLVDDWGYQRLLRGVIEKELRDQGLDPLNLGEKKEFVEQQIASRLSDWAADLHTRSGWGGALPQLEIHLPWPRTFEVEVRVVKS